MPLPALLDAVESLPAFVRLYNDLPGLGARISVGGLVGSSDAAVAAALARRVGANRFFVVVAESLPEAERWLADLESLIDEGEVALYPPREGFGEVEPHLEVAGERVDTLERLGKGEIRVLVTTARAWLERTRLPRAMTSARLELRVGDLRRLEDLSAHLEAVGFERVPLVEDVAQFSVRGGIVDIYGFGMANPVRLELWGDEIASLRHFDILTQRSTREAELALILPVHGGPAADDEVEERGAVADLFPPDTMVIAPAGGMLRDDMQRTWDEANHHIIIARRRGEDAPSREELYQKPDDALRSLAAFGTIAIAESGAATSAADVVFPLRPPDDIDRDIRRLRRLVDDGMPTLILCDNRGQCDRLDELLNEDARAPSPAALTVGVLDGGFIVPPTSDARSVGLRVLTDHQIFRRERRIRRHRRYATGMPIESLNALKQGDYVVHLEHGVGIYRGIEQMFVQQSTVEVAVIEYEGGDRLNVPLYRIDQIERYRAAGDGDGDAPPPRLHKLGGK
ncbi:MAG: CarD family transcriptional regulator, partial [Gemmatimonadaceae bacterium]